ncbi:hypothetical protein [Pseudomonas protegens]|uniref:hypothetical protein n=1 Tax=Pseudomonas protegens TaxID=380021 RepID=UPI002159FB95|nr:hypothetical protein [Pseudomonas protegens]
MSGPSPLTIQDNSHSGSAWERASNYEKEERPMRSVSKIVVKGAAVDVVFFRAPAAHVVVNNSRTQN